MLTDSDIIARIKDGDRLALAELYDRYGSLVHGVCVRIVKDEDLSKDLTQEVYLKVWQRPHLYNEKRAAFSTWVGAIARNQSLDYMRKNKPELIDMEVIAEERESGIDEWASNNNVLNHLKRLKPEYREVLYLAYYRDLSQTQIAQILDIPIGTVKSRTLAALKDLRRIYPDV